MTIAALTADKAASKSLKLVKARPIDLGQVGDIYYAARALAEAALVARVIPRFEELSQFTETRDAALDVALANMKKAMRNV